MKSKFVKSTKEKHADISHSHSGIAGVVSGIADGIAGHSLASGIAGDVSPGMLMEAHYGVYRPLLEAKTRYSFSGMGMRDGSSMQSIRLAMTSRGNI